MPSPSPIRLKSGAQSVAGIELLKPLTPAERQAVERRCRWRSFDEGEQIIDRETQSEDVFFVISGTARVVNYSPGGREVSYDDIGPGGVFGELAALDNRPRSASVVAKTDMATASLTAAAFRELLLQHPPIAMALLRRLAEVVRESTDRIMDLSTLGAHNRIFAELLRLARESDPKAFEERANQARIRPVPHHVDIASRVSTARETVARVMSDLSKNGVVDRERDAMVLLDVGRLAKMVKEFKLE
ncbi:MAG: Crp/Fnr family transcriptional regulator [Alphaproteobacteria bacterium]|nr:Crp/Fnr family transcriptional regulator [Alphaproteobacteria bacterium]